MRSLKIQGFPDGSWCSVDPDDILMGKRGIEEGYGTIGEVVEVSRWMDGTITIEMKMSTGWRVSGRIDCFNFD